MNERHGRFDGSGLRIGIVVARFNEIVTKLLTDGCLSALQRHGVRDTDITMSEVPGAREIAVVCKRMAETGRYDALIALGCVIRGETAHFDFVAGEVSRGTGQAAVETGVPVIFGVLTTDTLEQAMQRAGGKAGNAGWNAAVSAIETATLLEGLSKDDAEA